LSTLVNAPHIYKTNQAHTLSITKGLATHVAKSHALEMPPFSPLQEPRRLVDEVHEDADISQADFF
jgi:hypothetical protein